VVTIDSQDPPSLVPFRSPFLMLLWIFPFCLLIKYFFLCAPYVIPSMGSLISLFVADVFFLLFLFFEIRTQVPFPFFREDLMWDASFPEVEGFF